MHPLERICLAGRGSIQASWLPHLGPLRPGQPAFAVLGMGGRWDELEVLEMFEGAVRNLKILALAVLFYLLMTQAQSSGQSYYSIIVLLFVLFLAVLMFTNPSKPGGAGGIVKT